MFVDVGYNLLFLNIVVAPGTILIDQFINGQI